MAVPRERRSQSRIRRYHAPPLGLRVFLGQTWALTLANLKSRYRKTLAGFFWVVLNPLIMFGAQSYAFSRVLHLDIPNYSRFLLSGLLPWIFISQSIDMCTGLFVNSGGLLKSFSIHPLVFLFAQLADNLINFFAAFVLILVPLTLMEPQGLSGLLILPLALFLLLVGTLGLSWLLATFHVFFRDTRFVVSFLISVAFFMTPIFYTPDLVPAEFRFLVVLNPLYALIEPFQLSVGELHGAVALRALGGAAGVGIGSLLLAWAFWVKKRNDVYLAI